MCSICDIWESHIDRYIYLQNILYSMTKNESEIEKLMDKANTVVIYDNREAVAGNLCTGGCYQYIQNYIRVEDSNTWKVRYSTSSEIEYCPVCGTFAECSNCMDYDRRNRSCTKPAITVTTEKLVEKIMKAMSTDKMSVDIY